MNEVVLMGRLTADPELKQSGDNSYCRFTLAVNRRTKDAGADFIPCVTFGKIAESAAQWLKKGTQIVADGRIQTNSYTDQNGQKRNGWSVNIRSWEFAQSKNEGKQENEELKAAGINGFVDADDDLPFK